MNMNDFRKNYNFSTLSKFDLDKNPLFQFKKWLDESISAKLIEPNAMALSTSTKVGRPSCRMVLLKQFDESGFVFFTNYNSRKSQEIQENSFAAITFWWKEFERQVRIEGSVQKTLKEESALYFSKRPRKSQLAALASNQGSKISSRAVLEEEYAKLEKQYEGKDVKVPECWGGYRLVPESYEFWQGREDRMHDRFTYTFDNGHFVIDRLSP